MSAQAALPELTAECYQESHRRVFGLCRYLLGSRQAAEDAASEVFVKVQRAMTSYDASIPMIAWILVIARNHCLDSLRRRSFQRTVFRKTGNRKRCSVTSCGLKRDGYSRNNDAVLVSLVRSPATENPALAIDWRRVASVTGPPAEPLRIGGVITQAFV